MDTNKIMPNEIFTMNGKHTQSEYDITEAYAIMDQTF